MAVPSTKVLHSEHLTQRRVRNMQETTSISDRRFTTTDLPSGFLASFRGRGQPLKDRKQLFTAAVALSGLLLILSAGSAAAAPRYEPGPKIAPGVFLAEAPNDGTPRRNYLASPEPQMA